MPVSSRAMNDSAAAAMRALSFLLHQSENDFREAMHTLPFPPEQGFCGPDTLHSGDLFARALIADALCDAASLDPAVPTLLQREGDYLLTRQRRGRAGGWSYFPTLVELPPDADDLAQIMTVLLRTGRVADVRTSCELPLGILLEECAHEDGSLETWILPHDRGEDEELQARWAAMSWGRGPDPEVIANLLYALDLYDRARFATVIDRGCRYLARTQEADGSWRSTWYEGPFYGTYAAMRILARMESRESVGRAARFLSNASAADPMNAALATLALLAAREQVPHPLVAIVTGADQYPPTPLIRMELGRPSGHIHQVLHYGSRCVTAAFVLKAAIALGGG
jgi:squalene-hopene/tetraprenyl-beta-curcumene cyclase